MAANTTQSDVSIPEERGDTAEANPPDKGPTREATLGELEKVRNILFGEQVRSYDNRLEKLEKQIMTELAGVRSLLEDRVDQLNAKIEERLQAIDTRMGEEQNAREHDVEALKKQIGQLQASLTAFKKSSKADMDRIDHSLRETIASAASTASQDLEEKTTALARSMEHSVEELQEHKVNRTQLADMLSQIARSLGRVDS